MLEKNNKANTECNRRTYSTFDKIIEYLLQVSYTNRDARGYRLDSISYYFSAYAN